MMDQKTRWSIFFFLTLSVMVANFVSSKKQTPNIFMFIVDDLGYNDLSCYGNGKLKTKNLDKLASEGMKFNRMYSVPSDSGSMAAILTGRYPIRTGMVKGHKGWPSFWSPAQFTGLGKTDPILSKLFDKNRSSYFIGRWDLGSSAVGVHLPHNQGFKSFYGTPVSHGLGCSSTQELRFTNNDYFIILLKPWTPVIIGIFAILVVSKFLSIINTKTIFKVLTPTIICLLLLITTYCWLLNINPSSCILMKNGIILEQPYKEENMTLRMTQQVLNILKTKQVEPFFLVFSYLQPRYPSFASRAFKNKSGINNHYDSVLEIDWSVGKILTSLKENNLDNDTMVIFLSDTGPEYTNLYTGKKHVSTAVGTRGKVQGFELKGEKGSNWEGGIRVPVIMRWTNQIPANTENDIVSSVMDIFVTIADITNLKLPRTKIFDGRSLLPVFKNTSLPVNTLHEKLFHYCDLDGVGAVSVGQLKIHFKTGLADNDCSGIVNNPPLIYNISADPGETTPLNAEKYQQLIYQTQTDITKHIITIDSSQNSWTSKFDTFPIPWLFPCERFLSCSKSFQSEEDFRSIMN